jgi:HEPN domain-containing protein
LRKFADKLPEAMSDKLLAWCLELSKYYLNTRYPEYKQRLSAMTNREVARAFLKRAKETFQWLLTLKPSTTN